MLLILTTSQDWQDERRLILRNGQSATVGSTELTDFCIANDPDMAKQHFKVVCDSQGGSLKRLASDALLEVNGTAVEECSLRSGDRLRAGQTIFLVDVSGAAPQPDGGEQSKTRPSSPKPGTLPGAVPGEKEGRTAAEICAPIELSEAATEMLTPQIAPRAFFELLDARELCEDAVKFLAAWLPKRLVVHWAYLCLRARQEEMAEQQREAFVAAEQWQLDPSESNRKRAAEIATRLDYQGAASWLATAVGWTGGSITPPPAPAVPPPDEVVGQAVCACLMLSAKGDGDEHSGERFQSFVEAGKQLIDGGEPISAEAVHA